MLTWEFNRKRLRDLRELRGLSAVEFGRVIGRSHTTIQLWERGTGTPTAKDLAKICTAFQAIPASFFIRVNHQ
jgi:transcriptional regulator with XRE-family HTH domain